VVCVADVVVGPLNFTVGTARSPSLRSFYGWIRA